MSTKLSTDMVMNRPSTRTHAPPGGASSISFGEVYSTNSRPNPIAVAAPKVEPKETPLSPAVVAPTPWRSISVVVAGNIGVDVVNASTVGALYGQGEKKKKINLVQVENPLALPYVVQKVIKQGTSDIVIAVVITVGPVTYDLEGSLTPALLQIGVSSGTPVVPSIHRCDNLLEVRALMPSYARAWEDTVEALLGPLKAVNVLDIAATLPVTKTMDLSHPDLSADHLIEDLRQSLKAHGATGIFGIARKFKIIDDDGSGTINLAEFSKCIEEHSLHWTPAQVKLLFDRFDRDRTGQITFDEFLAGVRGKMNDRRHQLVLAAFQLLDSDKSGVIEVSDIVDKYDGSKHPDVITGRRTNDEILREFLDTFDGNHDGQVTVEEFSQYYEGVSASIDLDDYFELMMRNAWHMSGGVGWCANSTCRRVLVTHADGRQTVEEVKNDLFIKASDEKAIRANLFAQGITDVVSISTAGSVDTPTAPPTADPPAKLATAAAGQRPHTSDITATKSGGSRQAPGGRSTLTLG